MATAHKERDEVKYWRDFLCCYTVVTTLSQFSLGRCRADGKLKTFSYIPLKQKSSSSHAADRLKLRVTICCFESTDIIAMLLMKWRSQYQSVHMLYTKDQESVFLHLLKT